MRTWRRRNSRPQGQPEQGLAKVVGLVLRAVREESQFTQADLAFAAKLDRTYVSLLERGLRNPTLGTLFKITAVLSIRPSEIVRRIEEANR